MVGQKEKPFSSMPRITSCSCSSPWKGHIRSVFWVVWINWNKPVIKIYKETNLFPVSCHWEQVWVVKWWMERQVCDMDFAIILGSNLSSLLLFISSCLIHCWMFGRMIKFCEISMVGGSTFSFLANSIVSYGQMTRPHVLFPLSKDSPLCNF